jgi:hypothetical protein
MTLRVTQEAEYFLALRMTASSRRWILLHSVISLQEAWNMTLNGWPVYKRRLWTYRENVTMHRVGKGREDLSGFIWLSTKCLSVFFWTRWRSSELQKTRGLSLLSERRTARREFWSYPEDKGWHWLTVMYNGGAVLISVSKLRTLPPECQFHLLTVRNTLPLKQIWYLHDGTKCSINCNQ